MAWLHLRDKVIINSAELISIEARSSAGMSHKARYEPAQLESMVNLCFRMSDGSEFVRFFIPVHSASQIMEDLLMLLTGSRDIVRMDALLIEYGIRPADTY